MHSPFVYDFVTGVLNGKMEQEHKHLGKEYIQYLLRDTGKIIITDFGAGSKVHRTNERKTAKMAKHSGLTSKYGVFLHLLVKKYRPSSLLELGTCLGISTFYLATGNKDTKVTSVEGCKNLCNFSKKTLNDFGVQNVKILNAIFDDVLEDLLIKQQPGLVFIDGNHDKASTLKYFHLCMANAASFLIIVFDDIHWSRGMEEAWSEICRNKKTSVTIDLFRMGIVFVKAGMSKQHFIIKY